MDWLKENKDKAKALISTKIAKFMKATSIEIKKMGSESKFIQMEIYISESFKIIKNMEMAGSFGSVSPLKIQKKTST